MNPLTLVILAAGIGKRYGGLKQLEQIGPNNERLIDYSISDASNAGFKKVVLIIRKEIQEHFDPIVPYWEKTFHVKIEYAYQSPDKRMPSGFSVPPDREKPWGTAHAVLCTRDHVNTPFAVINADDYYGSASYKVLADFLMPLRLDDNKHAMVAFLLKNTLSPFGTVSRGICKVSPKGLLQEVVEHTKLSCQENKVYNDGKLLPDVSPDVPVSMNMWGFTPAIFPWLEQQFLEFLTQSKSNLSKAEYYLPSPVDSGIKQKKFTLTVLSSTSKWLGITYREDVPWVKKSLPSIPK